MRRNRQKRTEGERSDFAAAAAVAATAMPRSRRTVAFLSKSIYQRGGHV